MAEGEQRARLLGNRLQGRKFEAVYSSTLSRAIQTAVLAGYPPTDTTPLLVEVDYGKYDGITTKEIRQTNPQWDLWRDGCPGGETIPHVIGRAREFLELALSHKGDVIAFSHGHFLRAVACVFLELPIGTANRLNLETAALSILHSGDRGPQLELWNDAGHLPTHDPGVGSDN